jgi:hypothetical protein
VDPVSLVLTALASGAAQGATGSASDRAKAAHAELAQLVTARLSSGRPAEAALAEYAVDPQTWAPLAKALAAVDPQTWAPLAKALAACGAAADRAIIEAARELMGLLDQAGSKQAGYQVDLRGARGVQVGDDGQVYNIFNTIEPTSAIAPEAIYKPTLNSAADKRHHEPQVGFAEAAPSRFLSLRPEADIPEASAAGDSATILAHVTREEQEAVAKAFLEEFQRPADPPG